MSAFPETSDSPVTPSHYGSCVESSDDSGATKYSWLIAVLFCVGGAIVSNFGVNLQKMAHMQKNAGNAPPRKYRFLWFLGFLGVVGGAIGDFAALGFGAESVVAPLGSMTLVANVVMAPLLLKEKVTKPDLFATALIVFGCILAVAFASHKDCLYSTAALFALYRTTEFAVYAATIFLSVVVSLFVIHWMERRLRVYGPNHAKYQAIFKLHRFSYAAVSGIVGSQSILFAKTSVELVMDTANGGHLFLLDPVAYVILLSMGGTVTLQIYWLNCGLARWDALYNVPVFQSFWILVSVIGGGVFYREFQGFDALQWFCFPAGVLLTVIGVVMLSQRDTTKAKQVQDDADAEAVAGETAAGENGDTHDSDAEAPTNPLLLPSSASHAVSGVEAREVLVRFVDRQLGLTLKPKVIKIMANPKYPTVKMLVNCWVVTGFARMPDGSISAAEQSGVVMPGDIIAAVNNDSVLVRFINHTDVLKRLQDTPRPMVITFLRPDPAEVSRRMAASLRRGSYAGPAQSPPAAGAGGDAEANTLSPAGSALVRRRMAASARPRAGTGDSLDVDDPDVVAQSLAAGVELARPVSYTDVESGSAVGRGRVVSATGSVEDGARGAAASVFSYDDDDAPLEVVVPSRGPPERAVANSHKQLQHVSLGPLALALHTAQMIGPGQIDRDERKDVESHPLVHLVEKAFPEGGRVWKAAEKIVTTFDPDAQPTGRYIRRNSVGEVISRRNPVATMLSYFSPRRAQRSQTAGGADAVFGLTSPGSSRPAVTDSTPLSSTLATQLNHGATSTFGSRAVAAPAPPATPPRPTRQRSQSAVLLATPPATSSRGDGREHATTNDGAISEEES